MKRAELTGATEVVATGDQRPARSALSGRSWAIVIVTCYVVAAFIVTWRVWADPDRLVVTGQNNDQDYNLWALRSAATALSHGRLPGLFTTTLNAPQGINQMTNTSLLLPGI